MRCCVWRSKHIEIVCKLHKQYGIWGRLLGFWHFSIIKLLLLLLLLLLLDIYLMFALCHTFPECLTYIILFNSHNNPKYSYYSHFTDKNIATAKLYNLPSLDHLLKFKPTIQTKKKKIVFANKNVLLIELSVIFRNKALTLLFLFHFI